MREHLDQQGETPNHPVKPIFLEDFEASGCANVGENHVDFHIDQSLCAPGEDRIGFTTIFALVECVRQLHFQQDISLSSDTSDQPVDTITKSIDNTRFKHPFLAGTVVRGEYKITDIDTRRGHSYELQVTFKDIDGRLLAESQLVCVFYNGTTHSVIRPPQEIIDRLLKRKQLASND